MIVNSALKPQQQHQKWREWSICYWFEETNLIPFINRSNSFGTNTFQQIHFWSWPKHEFHFILSIILFLSSSTLFYLFIAEHEIGAAFPLKYLCSIYKLENDRGYCIVHTVWRTLYDQSTPRRRWYSNICMFAHHYFQ